MPSAIMYRIIRVILCSLILCLIGVTSNADAKEKGLFVYFLDVGQGDATIVLCDGEVMMIDGGDKGHSQVVASFLQDTLALDHIDIMVATHSHEDHIGGFPAVLNVCSVDRIYTPEMAYNNAKWKTLVENADMQGAPIITKYVGDEFSLGASTIRVLGPINFDSRDVNNNSLVLKMTYGNVSFLFPGDADWNEEHDILATGIDLTADVLHIAHHGSNDANGYQFIDRVQPDYGIISVGKNNRNGHPDEEVLSRLHDARVQVFRTDESGTILCYSDGYSLEFKDHYN